MPISELALAITHPEIRLPHLSRYEQARRSRIPTLTRFRNAGAAAHSASTPTHDQRTLLRLPLLLTNHTDSNSEAIAYFAWRASTLLVNTTRAAFRLPREFTFPLSVGDVRLLLPVAGAASFIFVARKDEVGAAEGADASASAALMRIRYNAASRCFGDAELEWRGERDGESDSESESADLAAEATTLSLSLEDGQSVSAGVLLRLLGKRFAEWVEEYLKWFVVESGKSSRREKVWLEVWRDAERDEEDNEGGEEVEEDEVEEDAVEDKAMEE